MERQDTEIDLIEVFYAIKKHLVLIIVLAILGGGLGFSVSKFLMKPVYEASVKMIVNTRAEGATNVTSDNINSAKNLVDTYAIIIKSNSVLNKVIKDVGLDMAYKQLENMVSVSSVNGTPIMKVVVQCGDPDQAGKIVYRISQIAPEMIVEAVDAGSCKIVDDVEVGLNPVAPSVKKYLALGVMGGIVLGMAFAVIKMLLQNTIVTDDDISKYLDLPVLGIIPDISEEYHA